MDITPVVSEFIEELLGLHSAYALTDIQEFDSTGDAAAMVRLRVRLCEAMMAEGWQPNEAAAARLAGDRLLLLEADDETPLVADSSDEESSALGGPASRVRDKARDTLGRADRRHAAHDSRDEVAQMRQALESRAVIEQAKGIAMERYGLRAEVAWSWLVRTSQNRNLKLRTVAEELVDSVAHKRVAPAHPSTERPARAAGPAPAASVAPSPQNAAAVAK